MWTWKILKINDNLSEIESVSSEVASELKEFIPKEEIPHKTQGWNKPELV